jgi:hypothetical protein
MLDCKKDADIFTKLTRALRKNDAFFGSWNFYVFSTWVLEVKKCVLSG